MVKIEVEKAFDVNSHLDLVRIAVTADDRPYRGPMFLIINETMTREAIADAFLNYAEFLLRP